MRYNAGDLANHGLYDKKMVWFDREYVKDIEDVMKRK